MVTREKPIRDFSTVQFVQNIFIIIRDGVNIYFFAITSSVLGSPELQSLQLR